jgi:hypothetical protein
MDFESLVLDFRRVDSSETDAIRESGDGVILYKDYNDGSYDYWLGFWSPYANSFVRHGDAGPVDASHWAPMSNLIAKGD